MEFSEKKISIKKEPNELDKLVFDFIDKMINKQDRQWYVKFWAEYVKSHRDSDWGRQQNLFINSLMQNARQCKMSAKDFLKIKKKLVGF